MKLLIVESPSKAKTINKYLGKDFHVEASYGHICALPSKNGSVLPEQNFSMIYEVSASSEKQVQKLCTLSKKADEIFLATDPDREGEAISWHVVNVLRERGAIKASATVRRVVFNEITKNAVAHAMKNPRDIDDNLVNAQQARSALDYLVGFTLSPVLWRKLPGARSAGRVQSVALRLICEREIEIENFKTQEFWDINGNFLQSTNDEFLSRLNVVDGTKLDKFAIPNQEAAEGLEKRTLSQANYTVKSIDKKVVKRHPAVPFTTSTLQQEAARKLGFSSKKTMQLAQKLYEGIDIDGETVGLITYMRTDGVYIANEAIQSIRGYIEKSFAPDYLPDSPRLYKAKSKNAQEAHEAIRPTNIEILPQKIASQLDKDMLKLYELIWKRTVACQMSSAELDVVAVDIISADQSLIFRANGSIIKFDGFYILYREGLDDNDEDDESKLLPVLKIGEEVKLKSVKLNQHFTEPPPRFTEATLIKRLTDLGIGRPSTYTSTLSVIQEREYAKLEKKRFIPEEKGRLVTAFLTKFFEKYVQYDFTAQLEEDLDKVADGEMDWKQLLQGFWGGFHENVECAMQLRTADVIDYLNDVLADHLFPHAPDAKHDPRTCQVCGTGKLGLRLSRYGAFIACSNYPECAYKRNISTEQEGSMVEGSEVLEDNNKLLGYNADGDGIFLKKGPYGYYVQQGENSTDKTVKPKRASVAPNADLSKLDLAVALNMLSLPKVIGLHPETGDELSVNVGKYGPYVKYGAKFVSIPKGEDLFTVTIPRAVEIIIAGEKKKKKE